MTRVPTTNKPAHTYDVDGFRVEFAGCELEEGEFDLEFTSIRIDDEDVGHVMHVGEDAHGQWRLTSLDGLLGSELRAILAAYDLFRAEVFRDVDGVAV